MTFKEFKALNTGYADEALIEDLEELCGLDGSEDYCEALDDFYAWGLSKENVLRPVVISANKKVIAPAKKKPMRTVLIVLAIAAILGGAAWYYFKIYKTS